MPVRLRIKFTFKRIDQILTREGFVDGAAGLLGLAAIAIGLVMMLFPSLFFRSGAWHLVFMAAQPWIWALTLIPCGFAMTIAAAGERSFAVFPSLILSVVFMLIGVLLTLVGSPVGVIAFGTLSTLTAMVFRVYIRESQNNVPAP